MDIVAPATAAPRAAAPLLLCFSHLRWDFVFQRPQQLMSRFAASHRVIFWEEPVYGAAEPRLDVRIAADAPIEIATPHLPDALDGDAREAACRAMLDSFVATHGPVALRWYYTPMMVPFSRHLAADVTVYDCMDELSAFRFAPPDLVSLEEELLAAADLVFTGGYSLYEAKRGRHPDVHPFPSSVDVDHFMRARTTAREPGPPRLGFYGVIDERMDLDLVAALADARPDWRIELVGPVVKIDPAVLPRRSNLSYPGPATYDVLPDCLARWDVALMPFAICEATRFISPTKTPEYLAAGRPVVSTPIVDVARHYGELDGVWIAATTDLFIAACDAALTLAHGDDAWLAPIDARLAATSWDQTVADMLALIREASTQRGAGIPHYDYLVVGAGFAGAVMAERLAADGGYKVLVIDRRPHIAGNAYDHEDEAGILIHQYGPHIFHTNAKPIYDYLSRFTEWRPYQHRVLADVEGQRLPIPINRTTINALYGLDLPTEAAAAAFFAAHAEPVDPIETSEDVVVSQVGRHLYATFFRGYTRKQWGLDPSQLDKSVTSRVPTRTNTDDRYFTDTYQVMPAEGYTAMFRRMLDHPDIDLMLGVEFETAKTRATFDNLVFTGPIDEYFGFRFGRLPYRSLRFRHETMDVEWHQEVAVVNYPAEDVPFTRVTEYKHLTGQTAPRTSVTYEYPTDAGDPYYPVPREENRALFKRYEALALAEPNVTFVGRLATYRYYNMDQVVGQALATWQRLKERRAVERELTPQAIAAE